MNLFLNVPDCTWYFANPELATEQTSNQLLTLISRNSDDDFADFAVLDLEREGYFGEEKLAKIFQSLGADVFDDLALILEVVFGDFGKDIPVFESNHGGYLLNGITDYQLLDIII